MAGPTLSSSPVRPAARSLAHAHARSRFVHAEVGQQRHQKTGAKNLSSAAASTPTAPRIALRHAGRALGRTA